MAARTVSQRQFAERCGVTQPTVRDWMLKGHIDVDRDGKIPLVAGLAQVQAMRRNQAKDSPAAAAAAESKAALQRAQVREREAKAEERELKLRRERAEVVDVAEVRADAAHAAEVIRARLLAVPQRVALQLEALLASGTATRAAQIEALLTDEINRVLEVLHGTRFGAAA